MVKKICAILLMIVFIIMTSSLIATAKKTGPPNEVIISKVPVEIDYSGKDDIGKRLAYQIKQMIHKSHSLTITHDKNQPRLKVSIIAMGVKYKSIPELSDKNIVYSLVISYPWKYYDDALYHSVGYGGNNDIKEIAEGIVINIDDQSETYYKLKQIHSIEESIEKIDREAKRELMELQQKSWWEKLWE